MKRCKHYDFDCKKEEMTCKGCAYHRPEAKTDVTYCTKKDCATRDECSRHIDNYQFDDNKRYSFIAECEEYQG